MILQIILTTLCAISVFVITRLCVKITKEINLYRDLDESNYKRIQSLVYDYQRLYSNDVRRQQEMAIHLGVQVDEIEKKIKQLEIHVFSVMQSSLYKEANND